MPPPQKTEPTAVANGGEWPELRVKVPPAWKRWLEEAAAVRAMSVSDLVRQCIRSLMVTRHDGDGDASS